MAESSSQTSFPKIHLLCMDRQFIDAFEAARVERNLPSSVNIVYHEERLSALSSSVRFDLVVSPANSYGQLDGGFDDAISRAFSPKHNYYALTRVVQRHLLKKWRGFAPPGTCTLVPFSFQEKTANVWGCKWIAICPTMRVPQSVTWDREIVYEAVWSLLCALDNHNQETTELLREMGNHDQGHREDPLIRTILMTPMATGCGRVSAERWAAQAVLAIKHFVQVQENAAKWEKLGTVQLLKQTAEVEETWRL